MEYIPVSTPSLTKDDAESVKKAIEDGWISSEGPHVREFEQRFAQLIGLKHGVAVSNGTAALDLAFEALSIGPGDEVILPSFTIISCLNQVLRAGATPIFVDADPATWNVDVSQIEEQISERTKAIVVVHIYGLPADIDEVLSIAKKYDLPVIEDSAEAHGQHLDGKPLGGWGTMSTFSFYPNKLITTGEGGMVLTNDDSLADALRTLRNLGFNPERRFVHEVIGWNYRMTSLQAALGLSQLERFQALLSHKKEIGAHYQELLDSIPNAQLPAESYRGSQNVYWVFGLVLSQDLGITARDFMVALHERGIGTRPFFFPLHKQPVLKKYGIPEQRNLPVSESLGEFGLYIPNGADSTPEKREYIASQIRELLDK